MKSTTKLINAWILAVFFVILMTMVWQCADKEYKAVTAVMMNISAEQLTQKAEITDIYREIQLERQRVSELANDVYALKLAMNLDGYHIELVPLLVPGDLKTQQLPEALQ